MKASPRHMRYRIVKGRTIRIVCLLLFLSRDEAPPWMRWPRRRRPAIIVVICGTRSAALSNMNRRLAAPRT